MTQTERAVNYAKKDAEIAADNGSQQDVDLLIDKFWSAHLRTVQPSMDNAVKPLARKNYASAFRSRFEELT